MIFDKSKGNCVGVDIEVFFPPIGVGRGNEAANNEAKLYCQRCVIADPCLGHALNNYEKGVWGGTTDRERQLIRKDRARLRIIAMTEN